MAPFHPSIRLRLTVWYALVLAVILAAFSAGVYLVLRQTLYDNLDESIQNEAASFLAVIEYEGGRPSLARISLSNPTGDDWFVRVYDVSAELTFDSTGGKGRLPVDPETVNGGLSGETRLRRVKPEGDDDTLRIATLPIRLNGQIVGVLELGRSEDDISDILSTLMLIMGVAYPATLAIAILGGFLLAGRALAPVDKITSLARRISAERLGQRLNLRLPDDEIGRLSRTFDDMIQRLEDGFRRQRQFTDDASHELRTPLTIMKGQIEVALQRPRDPEDYRRVLQAVNEEVDRLIRLTGSLLTLTRADAGQIPMTLETIDLAEVAAGSLEQVRSTAEHKNVGLQIEPGPSASIRADENLLLQLVLNLLDNAIKYTPSGGQVTVGWRVNGNQVELQFRDTGIGIAQEHLPYLFDRFYRVDKARSRAEPGAGLGLAISSWVAEAHGGSIRVESTLGKGSVFTLLLPFDFQPILTPNSS